MALVFFGLVIIMVLITLGYYRHQNSRTSIGGKISTPKAFWLGFALFSYFVFPVYLYFLFFNNDVRFIVVIIIAVFYFRMLVQGLLMFVFHSWIPYYGIAYNIFSFVVVSLSLVVLYTRFDLSDTPVIMLLSVFICKLLLILITDTFYAIKFQRIVGDNTTGRLAIWYAAEDQKFLEINRITKFNNRLFLLLGILEIIVLMIFLYGKS